MENILNETLKLKSEFDDLENLIKLQEVKDQLMELEENMDWSDIPKVKEHMKLMSKLDKFNSLYKYWNDTCDLIQIAVDFQDEEYAAEASTQLKSIKSGLKVLRTEAMFSGKYDTNNAILTVHAGSGGVEAQDWAWMLYRMYSRWADRKSFDWQILDMQMGDVAGVKSITLNIRGEHAFGYLKNEIGVHRLIRISPFDSQNRRHTSFAAVEVMPEIELDNTVEVPAADLRIDTYRASGAGGQHVNKTESAVRIVHIPSGITVECQTERSQHQNKDNAMKMLISKLVNIKEKEHLEEISQIKGEQKSIEWGSQIRTYTFMPYQLVKDHRTNHETGNIQSVMDGDIDDFIVENIKKI